MSNFFNTNRSIDIVSFSYIVNGKRYSSDKVKFGVQSSGLKSGAQKTVNRYPAMKHVKVYFNPNSPEEAVLEPGLKLLKTEISTIAITSQSNMFFTRSFKLHLFYNSFSFL